MTSLSTARLKLPFLAAGQAQKELSHNEALAMIDAALNGAAETLGLNLPPSAPAPGQCWIVGTAPTGAWADQAGALACWTEAGWRFVGPIEGMRLWLKDQQLWATCRSSGWIVGEETAARLIVGAQQVVGGRQAAVAAPSGGTTVDIEARAAIGAILARLVAHGLIAA